MSYIQDQSVVVQQPMDGWLDFLKDAGKKAGQWIKEGAAKEYMPQQQQQQPYQPPPQTFMDKYGTLLLIGGLGLGAVLLIRSRK